MLTPILHTSIPVLLPVLHPLFLWSFLAHYTWTLILFYFCSFLNIQWNLSKWHSYLTFLLIHPMILITRKTSLSNCVWFMYFSFIFSLIPSQFIFQKMPSKAVVNNLGKIVSSGLTFFQFLFYLYAIFIYRLTIINVFVCTHL